MPSRHVKVIEFGTLYFVSPTGMPSWGQIFIEINHAYTFKFAGISVNGHLAKK